MPRFNADQVRWCENCQDWFEVPRESGELERCPRCGAFPRVAKCNRCGGEWRLSSSRFPLNCPRCKSPYFNRVRIQTRRGERR